MTAEDQPNEIPDPAQVIATLRARVAELEQRESERQSLAIEVRRQQFLLEKILDALPLNVFVKDQQGRFVHVNEHVERAAQRPRSAMLGRTDFDVFSKESAAKLRQDDDRVREHGGPLTTEERIVVGDTTRFMIASKRMIRFDETGEELLVGFSLDITDKKVAEQELAEKLALIEQQREAMLELSSPVIRVSDGVLVVPLIGELSVVCASRMVERLLGAIVRDRARQVILDLTGVPSVDVEAADALLRTAHAVGLIGARCMLVGLSPEAARSLAELPRDAITIETHATLADGLREARLRR